MREIADALNGAGWSVERDDCEQCERWSRAVDDFVELSQHQVGMQFASRMFLVSLALPRGIEPLFQP